MPAVVIYSGATTCLSRGLLPADIVKHSSGIRPAGAFNSHQHYSMSYVDLGKLDDVSLKRYRRVFQLCEPEDPAAPKEELIMAVSRHFTTQVGYSHPAMGHH